MVVDSRNSQEARVAGVEWVIQGNVRKVGRGQINWGLARRGKDLGFHPRVKGSQRGFKHRVTWFDLSFTSSMLSGEQLGGAEQKHGTPREFVQWCGLMLGAPTTAKRC